jgi:enoyl-CoA hydratase/carnithine racemase
VFLFGNVPMHHQAQADMTSQDLVLLERDGYVATVTLNRPQKLNAVTPAMAERIEALVGEISRDEQIRAVLIKGAGDRAFCVGSDITSLDEYQTPWQFRNRTIRPVDYAGVWARLRQPVIAVLHGYCLGGGLELALNCDIRMTAPDASFGAPEVNWGWIGGGGASQLLPRLIGQGRAFELLVTGERFSAADAASWGLVNRVVPRAELDEAARTLAELIASKPPIAAQVIKQAVRYAMNTPLEVGRMVENELVWGTFSTEDKAEGVRAFIEKRPPRYKGR